MLCTTCGFMVKWKMPCNFDPVDTFRISPMKLKSRVASHEWRTVENLCSHVFSAGCLVCTKFQRRRTTTAENGKKIISSGYNFPLSLSKTSSLIQVNIESTKAFFVNWNSRYYNVSPKQSQRHSAQHSLWNRKRQQRWRIACLLGQQWRFQRRIGTINQNGCSGHQGMEEGLRLH